MSVFDFASLGHASRVSKRYGGKILWYGAKILWIILDIIKQTYMSGSRRWGLAVPLFIVIANAGDLCTFDFSTHTVLSERTNTSRVAPAFFFFFNRFERSRKLNFFQILEVYWHPEVLWHHTTIYLKAQMREVFRLHRSTSVMP